MKIERFCELIIFFIKMRYIHKKRNRMRDAIRETKIKLYRQKQQLFHLKNEKKKNSFRMKRN